MTLTDEAASYAMDRATTPAQYTALKRAFMAGALEAARRQQTDVIRECLDTDTVLRALGFEPKNCRTDGGSLALRELLGAIEHLDVMIRRAARHEERDEVLRELDDRTNQTWVGKRKRWAALVRAQDAELCVLTDALWKACGDDEAVVRDTIASQRGGPNARLSGDQQP